MSSIFYINGQKKRHSPLFEIQLKFSLSFMPASNPADMDTAFLGHSYTHVLQNDCGRCERVCPMDVKLLDYKNLNQKDSHGERGSYVTEVEQVEKRSRSYGHQDCDRPENCKKNERHL